jgi:hypothetical protein
MRRDMRLCLKFWFEKSVFDSSGCLIIYRTETNDILCEISTRLSTNLQITTQFFGAVAEVDNVEIGAVGQVGGFKFTK